MKKIGWQFALKEVRRVQIEGPVIAVAPRPATPARSK